MSSQSRKLGFALLAFGIIFGLGYLIKTRRSNTESRPAQSLEQIFADRAKQAQTKLSTPFATLVKTKDWAKIKSDFHPEKQGLELAEVVRSFFIQNEIKAFSLSDQQELMALLIKSYPANPRQAQLEQSMILNQILRLPSPARGSESESLLLGWLKEPKAFDDKRSAAFKKLVTDEMEPRPEVIQALIKDVFLKFGPSRESSRIRLVEEMRNEKKKVEILTQIARRLRELPEDERSSALVSLARKSKSMPEQRQPLLSQVFQALKSTNPSDLEGALRCILPIHEAKKLSADEITKVVNLLTAIPDAKRTPFVKAKAEEIIRILQP
jgi:hypothetical protein